jgi:hypothetical protein
MENLPKNADEYICMFCKHICVDNESFTSHLTQHRTFLNEKNAKKCQEYFCKECNFKCGKQSNWTSHISTAKHLNRTFSNEKNANHKPLHKCSNCNKVYKAKNSLWYHMKKCTEPAINTQPEVKTLENKMVAFDGSVKSMEIITDLFVRIFGMVQFFQSCSHTKNIKSDNNYITNNFQIKIIYYIRYLFCLLSIY